MSELGVLELCPIPRIVVWDITYACPLRCVHCYSESGRRPSRQLHGDDLLRVTDALIAAGPTTVVIAGGEPLVVKELFAVAERMVNAGVGVVLYTSGWELAPEMLPAIMQLFVQVTVSVDGATPEVHDRIRGRTGSFARAMNALAVLDRAIAARRRRDEPAPQLAIDYVVMKRNFDQLRAMCLEVLPRFPELSSISFGAVIPSGLASRPSFEEHELLDDAQAYLLAAGELAAQLQGLAPASVAVTTTNNRRFQMHPDLGISGVDLLPMQVEPDGMVRAMPIYEGTIGNLLDEPLPVLWARAVERWRDPAVVEALTAGTSIRAWAEATRRIDLAFGAPLVRLRIARRPACTP